MTTSESAIAQASSDLPEAPQTLKIDVSISKVSTCQRRIKVTIPREDIDRYYDEAVRDLMPTALMPGFRPGRAPRSLVGHRFKAELGDQIRSKLLNDAMAQVGEQEKLAPISEPDLDVNAVVLPDTGPMMFEFGIEVRPEFDIPNWKGLSIRRPTREISAEDVEHAVTRLLRERGRLVPYDGSPSKGDLIVVNVRFLDGDRLVSEASELEIIVRPTLSFADGLLDGFDVLVHQSKAGSKVSAEVNVSNEAADEKLRGGKVTMEMEVVEVKKLELPTLSSELLSELGDFSSFEQLRVAVQKQLENQLEWHRRRQVRQQVASALTASATWDLPPDLLKRQSQRELERSVLELRRSGFDDDSIRRHVNELRQTVMASTARSLKEHFILERIAEDESITDASADYDEEIRAIAAQSGESPRRVRASLEKRGLMDVLRNQIIERKTLDRITSDAKFTDTPFEFEKSETDAVDHAVCGTVVGEEEIPTATHSESRDLRSVSRRG